MPKKDTIDDANDDTTENISVTTESSEGETQPKTEGSTNVTQPRTYSEAEYKGLQTVIAKRDMTIASLTNEKQEWNSEKQELINKLAEAEANHGSAITEKSSLDAKLTEAEKEAADYKKQVADLQKKNEFQEIVMKDFPDLANVAHLIRHGETEEEFRTNAKELREDLSKYIDKGVKNILSGASIPTDGGDGSTLGVDDVDKWYDESIKLAGLVGKEQEYEKAYTNYLEALEARNVE